MAVVAVGAIMRGSGVGMPSSRGEHVSLYPVASVLGGLQEKEMEVSDDDTTATEMAVCFIFQYQIYTRVYNIMWK